MERYSLPLALLDFVPNLAFLVGAYFLVKLAGREKPNLCTMLMAAGTGLVFLAGMFKAIWKLLFTLSIADITLFAEQQFVLDAFGFLLMLGAVVLLSRASRQPATAPLLAMAPWKIPFLATMVICNLGVYGMLATLAFRRRIPAGGALFALAIVCMLSMAGLSSGEQTVSKQWIEEIINTIGQSSFGLGAFLLYQHSEKQE